MIKIKLTALVLALLVISGCNRSNPSSTSKINESPTPQIASEQTKANSKTAIAEPSKEDIVIYSGNCTKYEQTLVDETKMSYTPVSSGFGKVVINTSTNKFSFFFKDNLVFTYSNYLYGQDDVRGGESYSFDAQYSAFRFTAERSFKIWDTPGSESAGGSFLGNEYVISDYQVN
jgi:hypothetical protein